MTEFLEYELLSPETADPVIMRITGQRERGFKDFEANNRVVIISLIGTNYYRYNSGWKHLCVRGENTGRDFTPIEIPLSDWPAVKQAIRELNEHYKEKDMTNDRENISMKEDRYEFDLSEWNVTGLPFWTRPQAGALTLTRKKPKVEDRENIPVKVEWSNCSRFGDGMGENGIDFTRYGYERYHLVQFRVTGYSWGRDITFHASPCKIHLLSNDRHPTEYYSFYGIEIRPDARERWSPPVLLPESIYSKLDEICRALESKANEVKG